jgi:hypothetical protein
VKKILLAAASCAVLAACAQAPAQQPPQAPAPASTPAQGRQAPPLQPVEPKPTFPITIQDQDKKVLASLDADGTVTGDCARMTELLRAAKGEPTPQSVVFALIVHAMDGCQKKSKP